MKVITLLLLIFGSFVTYSLPQQAVVANPFGFVMDEPKNWFPISKKEIETSLKRVDVGEATLERYLSQNQGKFLLFAYVKFRQDSFTGVNPKIEARVIKVNSPIPLTFTQFRPAAISTLKSIARQFDEQRYVVAPSDIKIGGVDSVYHISEFSLTTQRGVKHRVRSRTYLVPRGTYFFQISFVDEPPRTDCSVEFDELLESIKFLK